MRCRALNSQNHIIWFGKNLDEKTEDGQYVNVSNYAENSDAVVASLTQRLSVIKGELWYQINYGIPLTDNSPRSALFDSIIADIITSHPGVTEITEFTSKIVNRTYYYNCKIKTIFSDELEISNIISQ